MQSLSSGQSLRIVNQGILKIGLAFDINHVSSEEIVYTTRTTIKYGWLPTPYQPRRIE